MKFGERWTARVRWAADWCLLAQSKKRCNCLAVCSWICISLLFFRLIDPNGLVPLVSESIELRPPCHAPFRSFPAAFGGGEGAERGGSSHAF